MLTSGRVEKKGSAKQPRESEVKGDAKTKAQCGATGSAMPAVAHLESLEREHKRAVEALEESEERFRRLSEAAIEGIVIHEMGKTLDVNETMATMFGYERSEMIGISALKFVTAETRDAMLTSVVSGYESSYNAVCVRKDGSTFPAEICGKAVPYHGHMVRVGAIRDITERKQAEDALRESEERYRNLFEDSRDAIYVTDRKGVLVDVNQAFVDLFCWPREELIGLHVPEMYCSPIERNRFLQDIYQRGFVKDYELKLRKANGEAMDCLVTSTVRWSKDGSILGYQGIVRNITEHKRVQELLQETERRYRLLADNVTDGIWATDMDLRLTYVSPSIARLLGHGTEEAAVQTLDQILPPASLKVSQRTFAEELAIESMARKDMWRMRTLELELNCSDGSTVWTEVNLAFLRNESNWPVGVLWLAHDITKHKQRQQYVQLCTEAQEEERKRLARELHDGTVQSLAALSLDIDTVLKAKKYFSDETIESLGQVHKKVRQIAEEVSRFSHALRPSVLDHFGLLPAVELLADDLRKSGIATHIEVVGRKKRLPLELELGLYRITQEAAANIRKHSHATKAVITLEFDPDKVRAIITDNGKGFELPKRVGDFAARGNLGLIGMQERSQLLRGSFSVQSKVGRGTSVAIEVGGKALSTRHR